MYWYYKYPLILLLLLSFAGIAVFSWKKISGSTPLSQKSNGKIVELISEPSNNSENKAPQAAPKEQNNNIAENYDQPISTPDPIPQFQKLYHAAETQLSNNFLQAARTLAERAMSLEGIVEFDKNWMRAAELINRVNQRFMNSSAPAPEKERYTIQYGDSLNKIAQHNYTSIEAILRLNPSIQNNKSIIHPRQVVSLLTSAWRIRISKSQYILILYNNQKLYRLYHVGIGREDRTPTGTFVITSRLVHPAWTPPGKNIPYGDPENILGTHWLGLHPFGNTDPTLSGYGIHGTWSPGSIGTGASAGCIRLQNDDIEELFDFIPEPGGQAPPIKVTIEE